MGDAELLADLLRRRILSLERERRQARRNVQAGNLLKHGKQLVADAIGEVLVVLVVAQIGERQHGDGALIDFRRRGYRRRLRLSAIGVTAGSLGGARNAMKTANATTATPPSAGDEPLEDARFRDRARVGSGRVTTASGAGCNVRLLARQQSSRALGESPGILASRQARPLPLAKSVGDPGRGIRSVVDHHRQQERLVVGHQVRAVDRELPFQAEVTFAARLRVLRDDRHEERALLDLLADRGIPRVAAAQLAFIEPDDESRGAKRFADAPGGLGVLRRIAQENGLGRGAQRGTLAQAISCRAACPPRETTTSSAAGTTRCHCRRGRR